ncbi:MAG: YihY/virulence factor BrkB family protein [Bacteroidia bacterium]|nr:YihY/virulence factor BrkB family protein [Bacteroidia bacterium]
MQHWLRTVLRKIAELRLPGFRTARVGAIVALLWENITHPTFTLRGSAMAFSFFFALFPGLLFAMLLLSYLPFEQFEGILQSQLGAVLPPPVYNLIHDVVFEEVYRRRNFTLLSTSLALALYSLWQGMLTMLRAFFHEDMPQIPFWVLWLRALGLVFFLLLLVVANLAFTFIKDQHLTGLFRLSTPPLIAAGIQVLVGIAKFILLFGIVCTAIEVMYRAGMPRRPLPYWLSPGAVTATFLMGAAMKLLSWYFLAVANFSRFYGSIAAVIALMVWFYWLSIVLLVGFEINYSLYRYLLRPSVPETLQKKEK